MTLRDGRGVLLFVICSIVISGFVLGCSHSQSQQSDSSTRPSSVSSQEQSTVDEQSLKEIRSSKREVQKNLPISQINWVTNLDLESNVVGAWTGAEHIYLETEQNDLWAVSRRTGHPVWTFSLEGGLKYSPTTVKGIPEKSVQLDKQIRETQDQLSSLRAQINPDEEEVSTVTSDLSGLKGRREELEDDDRLYLVVGTTLHVVDREYGHQIDQITLPFAPSGPPFANTSRVLIPGYANNFVYFYRVENMSEIPQERVRLEDPIEAKINQVEDLYLFPTMGGTLYGYSSDNGWVWQKETDGELVSSPRVKGNNIYLSSRGMQVYRLSRFSGNENWTRHLETPISQAPWIGKSSLYVRDDKNRFYSFDLDSGETNWKKSGGPRSLLFEHNEQVYAKNASTRTIFVLAQENGEILNSGTYKPFSYVFRNTSDPVFLLVKKNGLIISARASKIGVEITTENIERTESNEFPFGSSIHGFSV